ncbi:hypothetical protein HW555_010008, partial [Spodoptera exigua]
RAKFGDSLEDYFYDKIALINRCSITGRKAVDCVLHGIDDRSVRLGAEAVQFDDLDKLLTYLRNSRNVKINPDKRNSKPLPLKNSADLSQSSNQSQSTSFKRKIRCANCKTEGHIGFGNSFVAVLGRINVQIEIDGVGAYTELLLVPDDAMKMPLMIGQTYTEQPHILIHKTCERFDILLNLTNVVTNNKISLHSLESVIVSGLTIVKVYTNPKFTGVLFVEGGLRTKNGVHHYIPTGIYEFNELGEGTIVINGLNSKTFSVVKDDLVARGKIAYEETKRDILRVMAQDHQSQSRPITLSDLHIGNNLDESTSNDLLLLLNRFRNCFAFSLSELGNCQISEMSISLQDNDPVVYRPYRLATKEKEIVREMIDELLENEIIRPSTS